MRAMPVLHEWSNDPREAIRLQQQLAAQVIDDEAFSLCQVRTVAGVDVSARRGQEQGAAAVALMSFPELALLECQTQLGPLEFPYRSGLLSWRELPLILAAVARLRTRPDVYLVDGMGRMHPRRFGLACHLGLWLDAPTVGVGKTRLLGTYEPLAVERGAQQPVCQRGEELGRVLRTRSGVKPLFVSVGHRVNLVAAAALVLACAPRYRLPEPLRVAHRAAHRAALQVETELREKSASASSGRPA